MNIDEIQVDTFYLRGSQKNSSEIIFVINVDKEKNTITTILVSDMLPYIMDVDKKLKLGYKYPFKGLNFYPLNEEAKKRAESIRNSFVKITETSISLRQQEIDKLEKQKTMLQNSI